MLATQNRTKIIPNKLVLRHEEFIVNKSLANKIHQVKSTINAENKNFEKIIVTRQKREFQNHSSQSKSRTTLEHPSVEHPFRDPYDFKTPQSKDFRVKTTDHSAGKLLREYITSPTQKIRGETSDGVQAGRGTLGYMFVSPRSTLDKPPLHKGNSYKSAVFDRIPTTSEKASKEIQRTGSLKDQLMEKEMELKYLKDEMKDWWHDDFKNGKVVQFKEISIDTDLGFTRTSPERSVEHSVKGAKSTTGKLASLKQNSNTKIKKNVSNSHLETKEKVQYNESLRILEKLQEKEILPKKKLEPLRKDKENGMITPTKETEKRSSSGPGKQKESKDFKLRFSTNLENNNGNGGILKLNKRYESQGVDVINETSDYENEEFSKEELPKEEIEEDICEGNSIKSEESFEMKKPKTLTFKVKVKNLNQRYRSNESDHEDSDPTRSESPQIVTTSKTLMLQSRVVNSRNLNNYSLSRAAKDDNSF